MSTMQSRTASMISTFEMDQLRFTERTDTSRSKLDSAPDGNSDEVAAAQARLTEPSFLSQTPMAALGDAPDTKPSRHPTPQQVRKAAPVPRITIHAFCESHDVLSVLERAASDRMMSRATVEIFAGGIRAATDYYRQNPAPNLIVLERRAPEAAILAELEELAEFCDSGTKVLIIGYSNDIGFYRELMRRGVSEYTVAPIGVVPFIETISSVYREASSSKLGQVYAFVGTKGGVGSSTIAHNVGWAMARNFGSDVVLADLDLPFGTAGLNFNIDPQQGVAEAIQDSGRLDEVLLDRLLTKCDEHLSLLAAPGTLNAPCDLAPETFSKLLEIAQGNVPFTILDIPHIWTSWARNALIAADEIVITAVPDLANLRNAKNLIEFLKQARPHDHPPKLVFNQVGMAKRPEIKPSEFSRALQIEPLATIPFDALLFGKAANNGRMVADISAKSPIAKNFAGIAVDLAGKEPKKERNNVLESLLALVRQKK